MTREAGGGLIIIGILVLLGTLWGWALTDMSYKAIVAGAITGAVPVAIGLRISARE